VNDESVRQEERAAAMDQDDQSRARALLAKVRAGVPRERLEVLALCGHPDALLALERQDHLAVLRARIPGFMCPSFAHDRFLPGHDRWLDDLAWWGPEPAVAAALGAAQVAEAHWLQKAAKMRGLTVTATMASGEERTVPLGDLQRRTLARFLGEVPAPVLILDAVRAWVACPCQEHVKGASFTLSRHPAPACRWAISTALVVRHAGKDHRSSPHVSQAVSAAAGECGDLDRPRRAAVDAVVRWASAGLT